MLELAHRSAKVQLELRSAADALPAPSCLQLCCCFISWFHVAYTLLSFQVLHLNHQFQAAVDAEEYELAASVLFELRQAEADRMFHALRKSVKAAEERNR